MTEPTPDCPLCGAKLKELEDLIWRTNDVAAAHLKQRRIERTVLWTLATMNLIAVVFLTWR